MDCIHPYQVRGKTTTLVCVACGDDDKDENGNGNGDDDELILKFDGLANFKPTEEPADFKVTVYKGSVADNTSTLEITVKITCGDDEASKKVNAVAGVATFKASDFDDTGACWRFALVVFLKFS